VVSCSNSDIAAVNEIIANDRTTVNDSSSLYARIDWLLDSNDNDKCTAFSELVSQEILVCHLF